MAFDYINEAFKKLDLLEEQMFDTSLNGINELSDFLETDTDVVRVIDPEAESEEDFKDSYVGKVIVNCNICHSHVFENKEDIEIEEDGSVNIETPCPYCGEMGGFTIVGEIAPYNASRDTQESEDIPASDEETEDADAVEVPTEDVVEEQLTEDFKEVSITTDDQHLEMTSDENGKVTVTTEPVENSVTEDSDVIVPVSDETQEEIIATAAPEEPAVDDYDFDFDEIDEEGFDELGESYLRNVYNNVRSFKTTSVGATDSALVVEGVITFESGAEKTTGFLFEAHDANTRGQVRFKGSNKHFSESADAFSLVGRVDNNRLFVESLKYNYTVNDTPVRGLVRRK